MAAPAIRLHGHFASKAKVYQTQTFSNKWHKDTPLMMGRRIVDLGHFGIQFDEGCGSCGDQLKFANIVREQQFGLCSLLSFTCDCGKTTRVSTSKLQRCDRKRGPYAVNIKASLGNNFFIVLRENM